ncbi:uncharacterized protein FIBRA_00489 [Fibroporia radiculosa]|uniref:DNA replication complex GINS protein SLD5 n=1 Tax=Fibroporia radiculosa TaxID=599839 RepID=J4I7Y9_9APHY|nr:uncharacterized protein FIBRA_00489 [Fibroporia radiculosa]CCL98491.1 predicted protein [Fibroporia radiculosa]
MSIVAPSASSSGSHDGNFRLLLEANVSSESPNDGLLLATLPGTHDETVMHRAHWVKKTGLPPYARWHDRQTGIESLVESVSGCSERIRIIEDVGNSVKDCPGPESRLRLEDGFLVDPDPMVEEDLYFDDSMKNKNKATKFPVARIKRIMQKDEEVGKVAQATPVVISKALELFLAMIIEEANKVTAERGSRRVEAYHLKHAVETVDMLDFLKEIVEAVPDPSAGGTIDLEVDATEGGRKRRGTKGKKAAEGEATPAPTRRRRRKGEVKEEDGEAPAQPRRRGKKKEREQEKEQEQEQEAGDDVEMEEEEETANEDSFKHSGGRVKDEDDDDDWEGDDDFDAHSAGSSSMDSAKDAPEDDDLPIPKDFGLPDPNILAQEIAEETPFQKLIRHWMNERHAPDILPGQEILLGRILDHVRKQSDDVQLLRADPDSSEDEHFRIMLVQTEVERVKFVVRSYIRTRLHKIERYARWINVTPEVHEKLSKAELDHAKRYARLVEYHFTQSVLQSLPPEQRSLEDNTAFMPPMKPDKLRPVFVHALQQCPPVHLPDGTAIAMEKGRISLTPYHVIEHLLARGEVELV